MVWLEDARTSLVGRQNCFGWKILELVWLDKMLEPVWLDKMLELLEVDWLENAKIGQVGRCQNWFGWIRCQNWLSWKILEVDWLENAKIGLVGRYYNWFGWKIL